MFEGNKNVVKISIVSDLDIPIYPIWGEQIIDSTYSAGYWTNFNDIICYYGKYPPNTSPVFAYKSQDQEWNFIRENVPDITVDIENILMEQLL